MGACIHCPYTDSRLRTQILAFNSLSSTAVSRVMGTGVGKISELLKLLILLMTSHKLY